MSYGNDEEQQTGDEYIQEVNVAMAKLGARGLSVLFASGDGGVFGRDGSSKAMRSHNLITHHLTRPPPHQPTPTSIHQHPPPPSPIHPPVPNLHPTPRPPANMPVC